MKKDAFLPPSVARFLALVLAALLLQLLPWLFFRAEGDTGPALYFIHLFAVIPLCALLFPLWAGLGGTHPLAACLPIGGALLLLPVYHSPAVGLACIVLALVGCVAGREMKTRKTGMKGKHHGGKRNR